MVRSMVSCPLTTSSLRSCKCRPKTNLWDSFAKSHCSNRALGVPPSSHAELKEFVSILDPENDGYATFEPFFAICALKFHSREHDSDAHRAEVEEAFRLFTNGQDGPITLAHLRRVAAVLKEDVDEELLKDMILEANGGVGVARGVGVEEFDGVMKSAGVWR